MQTKTYHIFEEDGEPILHRAEGTDIDWKAGKNPTVKVSTTSLSIRLACPFHYLLGVLRKLRSKHNMHERSDKSHQA